MADVEIELVVTDLDGTLWTTDARIPDETRAAVRRFETAGIPVIIATGRRAGSTRGPLVDTGWLPPAVLLNGALGVDLTTQHRFHRGGYERDDATAVLDAFLAVGIEPCIYVDDGEIEVCVGATPASHHDHVASFGAAVATVELAEVTESRHVLGFSVLGMDEQAARTVTDALAGIGTPHLAPDRIYGGHSLTVAPPSASKWDGVTAFCASRGIDPARVLAIGDGPNDLELLAHAAVAVVPVDGRPEAVALADHVVGPAAEAGWAELLDIVGIGARTSTPDRSMPDRSTPGSR